MLDILLWILLGGIIGWFIWLVMQEENENRLIIYVGVGTIAALLGGVLLNIFIQNSGDPGYSVQSLVGAILTSLIAILFARIITTPSRN